MNNEAVTTGDRPIRAKARRERSRRQRWIRRLIVLALVPVVLFVSSTAYGAWDDKAEMTTGGPYEASVESLSKHSVPAWFDDVKFGIFIH